MFLNSILCFISSVLVAVDLEMHKGKFKLKDKLVGVRRVRSSTGNSRGAKIVDCDEADEAEPSSKIHKRSPRSAETNEAWEALKKSSKELRASVKDPLPDAVRLAGAIHDGLRQGKRQEVAENSNAEPRWQDECQDRAGTSNDGPKMPVTDGDRVVQSSVANANHMHRSSLMKRNGTARTSEVVSSLLFCLLHLLIWLDHLSALSWFIVLLDGVCSGMIQMMDHRMIQLSNL